MKQLLSIFLILLLSTFTSTAQTPPTDIYSIPIFDLNGKEIKLSKYKGKKILIVNTASNCDYAYQYEALQELHSKYSDKVVVIAFPSNDFGKQEPGSDYEIKKFCEINYKTTFPIASKIKIIGKDIHPLYKWLTNAQLNGWNKKAPKWNFYKYLIDEKGRLIKHFPSKVKPSSMKILKFIQ